MNALKRFKIAHSFQLVYLFVWKMSVWKMSVWNCHWLLISFVSPFRHATFASAQRKEQFFRTLPSSLYGSQSFLLQDHLNNIFEHLHVLSQYRLFDFFFFSRGKYFGGHYIFLRLFVVF